MKVQVYAILKEHFEKEFTLQESFKDVNALKTFLIGSNPEAKNLLVISRFAVDNEFVENDYNLNDNDTISIMPPSSGG